MTLRPARSPSRHATLYAERSDSFVASAAASIATGWSEPVPGRELHPLESSAFHGALFRQLRILEPAGTKFSRSQSVFKFREPIVLGEIARRLSNFGGPRESGHDVGCLCQL